jgi:N6-adenosine-specific RNA methylase IME4
MDKEQRKAYKIDKEFAALIPPLTAEELAGLEENLLRDGIRDSLVAWQGKGILLDGHNRFTLAKKHDLAYRVKCLEFKTRDEAKLWIIKNQVGRRNLSESQRAMCAARLANLTRGNPTGANQHEGGNTPIGGIPQGDAAAMFNVSERSVSRAKAVLDHGTPEIIAAVTADEVAVSKAYADVTRETKRAKLKAKLKAVAAREIVAPSGEFDVIVCDPPWPMKKIERDVRPNQAELDYPTMNEEEIAALKLPCADDCHVWLWTTHKLLPMALRLLERWSLRYVCTFVWHKPGGFQPIGLPQFNCEFALYARRGSPQFLDTKALNTCFEAPRGKHSEKPEGFYEVLRRVTGGRRLDMFNRRPIKGFSSWGNEA